MDEDASEDTISQASTAISTVSTAESIEDWQSDWQSTDNEELSESSEESSEDEAQPEAAVPIVPVVKRGVPIPRCCSDLVMRVIHAAPSSERTEAHLHRALGDAINEIALRRKFEAAYVESHFDWIIRIWQLRVEDRRRSSSPSHYSRACELCFTEAPATLAAFSACGHLTCAACATQWSIAERVICPFCRKYSEIVCLVEEEGVKEEKPYSPIYLLAKVATAQLNQWIFGKKIENPPEEHIPRLWPEGIEWSNEFATAMFPASEVAGADFYEYHRLMGDALEKENLQAVDIDPITKEEKINRMIEENEQSLSSNRLFTRTCRVCLISNPLHRVVYTSCGHLSCLPCADSLLPYGGNAADMVRVACPTCGERTAYVRVFEKLSEDDSNNNV